MKGEAFSAHFGGASHFRFIDAERATGRIVGQADVQAPEHVPGAFPRWLAQQGVKSVIVGGIGKRAVQMFVAENIAVFIAKPEVSLIELVSLQMEGRLAQANMNDCCPGHGHEHARIPDVCCG